jgi:hypothetical protein
MGDVTRRTDPAQCAVFDPGRHHGLGPSDRYRAEAWATAGPTSDQDVEEFIYDALELLPGAGDVEVRCEGGRTTLTGSVPHKRLKRDVGEIAWAIPGINDVQNNIGITTRRRSRAFTREPEPQQSGGAGRKQS